MLTTTATAGGDGDFGGIESEKCVHETFKEADELKGLVNGLDDIWKDTIAMEAAAERFRGEKI